LKPLRLHPRFPIVALFGVVLASVALGDTIYAYTGNQFNDFRNGGTCPPVCNVIGFFTVAQPLAANLPELTLITPAIVQYQLQAELP
jgi:hypothetical protein